MEQRPPPRWFPIAGYAAGVAGVLFFMYVALFQQGEANFAHIIVMALIMALAMAFLGGDAVAKGSLPIPLLKDSPMTFALKAGAATFAIVLVLGYTLFLYGQAPNPKYPEYVSIGFEGDQPLSAVFARLEAAKGVTVVFSPSCPADFKNILVTAGTHNGNTPREFIEGLHQRLRTSTPGYRVVTNGKKHEIVCN